MVRPTTQQAYTVSNASGSILAPVQEARDPTSLDVNYQLYQQWVNTSNFNLWQLMSFVSTSGTVLANWFQLEGTTSEVHTLTGNSGSAVGPTSNNINILGAAGEITVTGDPATSTLTLSLTGGSTAVDSFAPDTGTNPVVPTALGLVNVKGQSTPNTSGIRVTGGTNELDLAMFSPFLGDFTFTKSSGASTVNLVSQHTGANTALVSSLANSAGNGAGFFSSGQYDTTKYWNFGMVPTNAGTNAGGYNISYNTIGQSDPSGGTPTFRISTTGNITVPVGDLTVTRATGLPEIVVSNTSTSDYSRFRAVAASPKTGFFSSGIDTPLYWNFGMASTLSNAFCLNTSNASVAPEGGTIVLQVATGGMVTIPAGDLQVIRSVTTGGPQINLNNTSNNANASARMTIGTSGGGDIYTLLDAAAGSPGSWEYGNKTTDSSFQIQAGPANTDPNGNMDGTLVFKLLQSGQLTLPLQPAFFAYLAATATDKTGNGASYTLGADALTVVYGAADRGSSFTTAGVFTAPVTGVYDLRAQITVTGTTIATSFVISIVVVGTSARTYINTFTRSALATDQSVSISALALMTATDTATVTIVASGEAANTDDILGAATAQSYFCGTLVC